MIEVVKMIKGMKVSDIQLRYLCSKLIKILHFDQVLILILPIKIL